MKGVFLMLFASFFIEAGMFKIFNTSKVSPPITRSHKYVSFLNPDSLKVIVFERGEVSEYKKRMLLEGGFVQRPVFEDDLGLMVPTGEITIKVYNLPKTYQAEDMLARRMGFENCRSSDFENYTCEILNDKLMEEIVLTKLQIEKRENMKINIGYFHLFK